MDPTATWSIKTFIETFGGPGVAVLLLVLNLRGIMWWKPQVDKLLAATVEAAQKLDVVRIEQINVEREDKIAWKEFCDSQKASIETMKSAIETLKDALEDEKRRATRGGP